MWPGIRYVTADLDSGSIATMTFDIMAIPFSDRSFDVIICNHVLEHVSDDNSAIREMYKVLHRVTDQEPIFVCRRPPR
jgi:ubiquinone/menaquinone biosynthesis C-methylase UbiE